MSKRRQTIAAIGTAEKKLRQSEAPELISNAKDRNISDMSVAEIKEELKGYGQIVSGPVNTETRYLYEKLLTQYREGKLAPKPQETTEPKPKPTRKSVGTPNKTVKARKKEIKSPSKSPEKLTVNLSRGGNGNRKSEEKPDEVEIETLPDPPSSVVISDAEIRKKLTELGQSHGPINNTNRLLYLKLIEKYENPTKKGGTSPAKKKIGGPSPVKRLLNKESGSRSTRTTTPSSSPPLDDYPEDSEMTDVSEHAPSLAATNFSYIKSPYKKTRRSVCREEFEDIDFLVNLPSRSMPNQRALFIDLKNRGVQGVITDNCSTIELVNIVKGSSGSLKVYAGIVVTSLEQGRKAVTDAMQCGVNAVVLSFSPLLSCNNPKSVVQTLEEVVRGHLTVSYFYSHRVKACPVSVSKALLRQNNGFQGIMISTETVTLLRLEALGIKVHETDVNNMLRSLAHGVESIASYEGIIGMPLMRKLKEEYYEGNTSECCRLQLILCRLAELLQQYGDLIPSIHTALKYLNIMPGELPLPYTPLPNEIPLIKELANMEISKWQSSLL